MTLPPLKWWQDLVNGLWRPFAAFGCAATFFGGTFDPGVTEGKLAIVGGILGVFIGAKSFDKHVAAKVGAVAPSGNDTAP